MNLDSLFNNFLTSGISFSDPETLRKFKVANSFQLVFVMAAPFLGLIYFYIGALFLFFAAIGAGILMLSSLVLLRATKNLALGCHYAVLIAWAFLLFISWNTGAVSYDGVLKPIFILNTGLILLSIFLLGYSGGTIWTSVVFLEAGLIVYLHHTGYQFPDLIPPEIASIYSLGTSLVALLCILLFAFLFEKERDEALIREREKSEALRESKRYIDDILKNSPVPTFILDRNHRVVHWNAACANLSGIPAEEILGKRAWEGFFVDERGSVADILLESPRAIEKDYRDAVVTATDSGWFELNFTLPKLKNGARAMITASPIVDQAGTIRGAIEAIQVVETSGPQGTGNGGTLSQIEEQYGSPVFRVDSQARITYWNQACEREYQYPASEMIGKSIFSIVSKNHRSAFKDTIVDVLDGKSFTGRTFKYYTKEGKPLYVIAEGYPIKASEDARECAVMNRDVTELLLKMHKLELYAAETKEKLKSLSEEHDLLKRNIASFIRKKDNP